MTGKKAAAEPETRTHPRLCPPLLGHEAAEAQMVDAVRSGRLAHAWLIEGPRGVGKATLAFRFARFLLSGANGGESGGCSATPRPASMSPTITGPRA